MTDRVTYKREWDFSTNPPTLDPGAVKRTARNWRMRPPHVSFTCECGGICDTSNALRWKTLEGHAKFVGVPCSGCGDTYTVTLDHPDT